MTRTFKLELSSSILFPVAYSFIPHQNFQMHSKTLIGYCALTLVVLIWVASGYLIQWIFTASSGSLTASYPDNPMAMTVISVSLCSLLLFIPSNDTNRNSKHLIPKNRIETTRKILNPQIFVLGLVWFIAQLTYNVSLQHIAVSTSSSISALSSFFSYLFSIFLLRGYKLEIFPILGIVASIVGIQLLVKTDSDSPPMNTTPPPPAISGIILAIISCALYGLFGVLLKRFTKISDSVIFVFGQLGLVALILGIPLLVIANILEIEIFAFPSISCFLAISINALFGSVLSDVLLAKAIMCLSPMIVSVGLTFTIPVSLLIEKGVSKVSTIGNVVGYLFVLISLVLVSSSDPQVS